MAFSYIAGELGIRVDEKACPDEPGGLVERLRVLGDNLAKACPDERELLRVLGFLASLEDHVGEEEYTRMLIPALRSIMGEKFEVYEPVLESIVRDEENHAAIVRRVYESLSSGQRTGQKP